MILLRLLLIFTVLGHNILVVSSRYPTKTPTVPPDVSSPPLGLLFSLNSPNFLYAPDPNALTVNDTLYVFCSHDPPNARQATKYSGMKDYILFTFTNHSWVNHGVVLQPISHFNLNPKLLYFAPGAMYYQSYFYLYFPMLETQDGEATLGVARTRTPYIPSSWELVRVMNEIRLFDPAILVDPQTHLVHLLGSSHELDRPKWFQTNILGGTLLPPDFFQLASTPPLVQFNRNIVTEAVFGFVRMNRYYLVARVVDKLGDSMRYWISDSPLQTVLETTQGKIFTSNQYDSPGHGSAVEFRGKWFWFYHSGAVNSGNKWKRSTCVDEMHFKPNGEIVPIRFTCKIKSTK